MEIDLNEIIKKIQDIREKAEEEIEDNKNEVLKNMLDLKVKYLGKKSEILGIFKYMKNLTDEEKKKIGENINKIKFEIESKVTERIKYLERKEILEKELKEKIDLSLPVQSEIGTIHPIQQIIDDQIKIFNLTELSQTDFNNTVKNAIFTQIQKVLLEKLYKLQNVGNVI